MVAGVAIMASALFPGVLTTAAAGIPDVGNAGTFELDGNVAQDTATPPPYDWQCVFNTPAHTGCPPSSQVLFDKVFQADYGNPDPTYFSGVGAGIKDINNIDTWGCVTLNNPLNKDDILNAYGAAIVPASGPKQGHLLVYLAQERDSNNGDSFAGFWLMKHQHTCTNGTFNGLHDQGDLLVVSNYTNGGTNATVELWEWDPANVHAVNNLVLLGTGFTCGQTPPASVTDPNDMCGIANSSSFTEPWAPNLSLGANQFVEVGVDVSDLLPPDLTSEQSVCFSQFLAETRSSQELTATLKDYTSGQFHLCVTPTVTTQQTANGHTSASMTVVSGTAVSDQATLSGVLLGTPGGTIDYKLFNTADCSGTPVFDSGALPLSGGVVPSSGTTTAASAVGLYQWQAFYSGDILSGGRNRASSSTCGDEPLVVVNANILVTPHTAVNEVGNQHVFDVTVNALAPAGQTVSFAPVTTSVTGSPAPSSQSTTCGAPTVNGYQATCTVTINSTSVATYTVNASDVITINGLAITRATNGTPGPGGTGPATKDYVDASVAIGPATATNAVGAAHTFTITVTAYPGTASPVVFNSITTSISPTPSSMSTTCGSPTVNGNVATCTMTINSTVATQYTANATAVVTIGGVQLTRTTAPDGSHAGPGGSGPAIKIYGQPTIAIAPSAVNEVGHQHVFTVTVTSLSGQTTTFNSITPSVTPTPDSMSTTCGSPTVVANVATCTVTINNSTAGVFTATATAVLTVNGFQMTLTTNGSNGNSGAATKTYVDASIAIGPSAVNEVGHQHVFTVTVTGLPGNVSFAVNSITTSVSPTPDSSSSTCGSPTVNGNVATCTLTINSTSAGTFTANAAADVTVDGLLLHRSTDGSNGPAGPGGSGSAVKNFVDASVGIGPSAVNPIGQEHVFSIVVNAYPAGATPVSFDSITPSVDPTPGSMSTTCDTPTVNGDQATCTLTIDNDLPDNFTANVTAVVTMGGVTVTRSTSGNAGPGGTGPATKTYVSANIGLSPLVADDPVGDLHTLTATVTTNNGSGDGQPAPAPDGTVVDFSIVSGPGSLASPSCTISNGEGTCTDVLTSDVEGTTVVQATVTITVDGVTLRRTTGDSVPGDSANAVKNWHKVQPTITTTQSAGGTIGIAVSDTAAVAGGHNPTGTVSFALFGPTDTTCTGTPVFLSANQPLSGGHAASGSFTPAATGTYQWVATYNGDDGNLTAVSGCGDEPVTIVAAAVQAITTPNTGAAIVSALAEGMALMFFGAGLVAAGSRRRRQR